VVLFWVRGNVGEICPKQKKKMECVMKKFVFGVTLPCKYLCVVLPGGFA